METHRYRGITWLESFAPTESHLDHLAETYDIDHFIIHDILSPTPYLYTNQHGNALYAVFHFPVFRLSHTEKKRLELDMVIKKDFLATVRYDSIEPLEVLAKKIQADENISRTGNKTLPSPTLANIILKEMYLGVLDDLASFSDWLHDIEDRIYNGKEKEMVTEISLASRTITEFRLNMYEHERQLLIFEEIGTKLFAKDFETSFGEVARTFEHVRSQVQFLTDIVVELRETNNSLVSTKQNEIMKVLTIMAFITFPLSLIASIFGMNTAYIPLIGGDKDFWIVMFIMGISTLLMFGFFKYKKWI